jgi:hypothetical protein
MVRERTAERLESWFEGVLASPWRELKRFAQGLRQDDAAVQAALTLAEADADLQRLLVLQKHHADEQFLARRKLRELPEDITRLARRRDGMTQDMTTATTHAHDPITIGSRTYSREDALEVLGARLHSLPALIPQTRDVPLGVYRGGLRFGLVLHPHSASEVSVAGALTRCAPLSREFHGPRATLNAIERLLGSYEAERDKDGQGCRHSSRPASGLRSPPGRRLCACWLS